MDDNEQITINEYSWNTNANLLFIDQPVGTGYSYTLNPDGYQRNEKSLSSDLYAAIKNFFDIHPVYSGLPLYVFGESYAGKYEPWLAHTILLNPDTRVNLKGIGIGNGWVSPIHQARSYGPFLQINNRINQTTVDELEIMYQTKYLPLLLAKDWDGAFSADEAMMYYATNTSVPPVTDIFDIRQVVSPTDGPYYAMERYFKNNSNKPYVNAANMIFHNGNKAYRLLDKDEEKSANQLFADILANIPVLIYSGNYDFVCNYVGGQYWTANIEKWQYQQQFNNAVNQSWTVDGVAAGYYKSAANLIELIVYNAGHMSPFDQPKNVHNMVYTFIAGGFFNDSKKFD